MFYVKSRLPDGTKINLEITDENVFTVCPDCGEEHSVNIAEVSKLNNFDLCGTVIYCADCSKTRQQVREAGLTVPIGLIPYMENGKWYVYWFDDDGERQDMSLELANAIDRTQYI